MEEIYLTKAIKSLRPTAQFSFQEADYSTIKWDVLEGEAPSAKEVDEAIKNIKIEESQQAEKAAAKKAAILERLGLTEEEAKLLLS